MDRRRTSIEGRRATDIHPLERLCAATTREVFQIKTVMQVLVDAVQALTGSRTRDDVRLTPSPVFTRSGTSAAVFEMPATVSRIEIAGAYPAFVSNFIVTIAGRLIVDQLMGTGFNQLTFTGTYLTSGGAVEITRSAGITWTLTEVR